jgi:heme o synthase
MSGRSILIEVASFDQRTRWFSGSSALSDYWALTKPEVNLLIQITTLVGFRLGCAAGRRSFSFGGSFHALLGTLLVASGTAALNQYIERRFDAQMCRTSRRPVAAGRLRAPAALAFGISLAAMGTIYLAVAVNLLASGLALVTLLSYLFLYTPLKRKTPLCTLVGAFPGAMPPLIGWAAATGRLTTGSWIVYAILFLWQFPHFMAIAWMYREDYDRAGYQVLPEGSRARITLVNRQTLLRLLALLPASLLPALFRGSNIFLLAGTLLLSLGFLYHGARFVHHRSNFAARQLLTASIVYLPSLFLLMAFVKPW